MTITKRLFLWVIILLVLDCPTDVLAHPKTVTLPLTLEYPLIRSILVRQIYTQPGEKAVLRSPRNPCVRIELSEPEIKAEGSFVLLWNKIKLQAGLPLGERCLQPLDWEGYIAVRLKPYWDPRNWRLYFKPQETAFYDLEHNKQIVAQVIWELIEKVVRPPLDQISINLAPPVQEISQLLPRFLHREEQEKLDKGLRSLRPGSFHVGPGAMVADILADVDIPQGSRSRPTPESLSDQEKAGFIQAWETWDSFLVHELLSLVGKSLSGEEKGTLLSTLLKMRYGFLAALDQRGSNRDLVREQFLKSWTALGPILRKHLVLEEAPSFIGYLGFFTAMDSLNILDQLGGTFRLEISQDGLIRLARLISKETAAWRPEYSFALNPELRRLLGFGDPIIEPGPAYEEDELELDQSGSGPPLSFRSTSPFFTLTSASSKGSPIHKVDPALRQWIPDETNIEEYLDRVENVLAESCKKVLARDTLEEQYHDLFRILVSATAWQESCWRQLTAANGKVRYLLSYNGSSVGLMQINVRVWRGLYEPKSLRWNIRYNVRAGTEILELYLRRYVLSRSEKDYPLDPDMLGGVVYAIYRGGPDQFERFLIRSREGRLNTYDRLFLKKFEWVKQGEINRIQICITGKES